MAFARGTRAWHSLMRMPRGAGKQRTTSVNASFEGWCNWDKPSLVQPAELAKPAAHRCV